MSAFDDDEWEKEEARAERESDARKWLSDELKDAGVPAYPYQLEGDILVEGGLFQILEIWEANKEEFQRRFDG